MGDEVTIIRSVEWIDHKREAVCQPDYRFPDGVDLDLSQGREPSCIVKLPYPAKRCGHYVVTCHICRQRIAITTAGRADDPRSVTISCMTERMNPGKA